MNRAQLFKNAAVRRYREKVATHVVGALIMVGVSALLLFAFWYSSSSGTPANYEGKVVDRWADYVETDLGSRPRFRLLIETDDGKRFPVKVDANVYESARVGMRIRSRAGQVVLIEASQLGK